MDRILECSIQVAKEQRRFIFKGAFTESIELTAGLPFEDLQVLECAEEEIKPFSIHSTSWHGKKLTAYDAIADVFSQYTRLDTSLEMIYLHSRLKAYLDPLKEDCICTEGTVIPKRIVFNSSLERYDLIYATDRNIYYKNSGDAILMLQTDTRKELASNYFAVVGLKDSVEKVSEGKEILYYCSEILESL